jgi:hypothetical protein
LRPGDSLSVSGVSTNNVLEFTLAASELVICVRVRHVVFASNKIVDVLAVIRSGDGRVAELDAEGSTTDEVVPLNSLEFGAVALSTRETGTVDESTERVSSQISTVRIELSSRIVRLETKSAVLDVPSDLDVSTCFHELGAGNRTCRDETAAMG